MIGLNREMSTLTVSTYPGIVVGTVVSGDSWSADATRGVFALSVGPVLAYLSVVGIIAGNDDVFSDTLSDYGFLLSLEDSSVGEVDFSKVELQSGSDTSLHVLGPDGDALVENNALGTASFNLDSEGLRERSKLGKGLLLILGVGRSHFPFSIVHTKLDVVELDIENASATLDVKFSSEVDGGSKAHVVLRSSDQASRVTVNVFLAGLEQGCAYISLHESGAAEHKA